VPDSFEQALAKTLPLLRRIRQGFGPYPTASAASLEKLKLGGAGIPIIQETSSGQSIQTGASGNFENLRDAALACLKCPHLVKSRTQVVFGVGNPEAELMFVGEAPGADEDAQGEPFVGRAGQLLTKIIQAMGYQREDVYIANVLKCRPPGNRDPLPEEIATCQPYLAKQVDLIEPRVICTLGNFATKLLTGNPTGITKVRGAPQSHLIGGRPVHVFPLLHPAAALRTPAMADQLREDFTKLPALLHQPLPDIAPPDPIGPPTGPSGEGEEPEIRISDDQMNLLG
jgi:uracil-DNA glycosylase family 4